MGPEEAYHGLAVHVILMLGGLHGLRFNEECAFEAFCACVVACEGQHHCQVLFFALLVGVEDAHVAFAASPEHIVGTAQLYCGVDGVLNLYGGAGHYVEVGIGGGSVHVAGVAEYVGGAPEILDACLGHLLLEVGHDFLHVGLVFLDGGGLAHKVYVVEAEILYAEFLHDFEACVGFVLRCLHGIGGGVPGELLCAAAELVAAFGAQCVPPCHGKLEPVFHFLASTTFSAS